MWRESDYQGSTNWDTWNVGLMIDNERETQEAARAIVEKGIAQGLDDNQIAAKLAEWGLRKIVGPHNKNAIADAKSWNEIPPEERIDHSYEEFKDKHGDDPKAMDLFHGLVGGPDVSDSEPTLIDPEIVNWLEIVQDIKGTMEENERFERDEQQARDMGLGWANRGGNESDKMRDAVYRYHGALPEEELAIPPGKQRPDWNDPQAYYNRNVTLTPEEFMATNPRWDNYITPDTRVKLWSLANDLYPDRQITQYERDHLFDQHWDDPRVQEIVQADPNYQEIMKNGYTQRLHDYYSDLDWAITHGRDHPHKQLVFDALAQRGYTPEEIAEITKQRWQWKPNPQYLQPDAPYEFRTNPGDWIDMQRDLDKAEPIDPTLDQPGDFKLPDHWGSMRTADEWDDYFNQSDTGTEYYEHRRPFVVEFADSVEDPNPRVWIGEPNTFHADRPTDFGYPQPQHRYYGEIWENTNPPTFKGAPPDRVYDEQALYHAQRAYYNQQNIQKRASDGADFWTQSQDDWWGTQNDSLFNVNVPGETPGMRTDEEADSLHCPRCMGPMHELKCPSCGFEKVAANEEYARLPVLYGGDTVAVGGPQDDHVNVFMRFGLDEIEPDFDAWTQGDVNVEQAEDGTLTWETLGVPPQLHPEVDRQVQQQLDEWIAEWGDLNPYYSKKKTAGRPLYMGKPGDYRGYLEWFAKMTPEQLQEIYAGLPQYGAGWSQANYRRALERVMREQGLLKTAKDLPPSMDPSRLWVGDDDDLRDYDQYMEDQRMGYPEWDGRQGRFPYIVNDEGKVYIGPEGGSHQMIEWNHFDANANDACGEIHHKPGTNPWVNVYWGGPDDIEERALAAYNNGERMPGTYQDWMHLRDPLRSESHIGGLVPQDQTHVMPQSDRGTSWDDAQWDADTFLDHDMINEHLKSQAQIQQYEDYLKRQKRKKDAEWAEIGMREAGMTNKQLLEQMAALPPDRSTVEHEFPDGWTIRKPGTFGDIHRVGELMGNCWSLSNLYRDEMGGGYDAHPDWPRSVNGYDGPDGWEPYAADILTSDEEYQKILNNLDVPMPSFDSDPAYPQQRWLADPEGIPHAAFYYRPTGEANDVSQMLGRHNSAPKPQYVEYVQNWLQGMHNPYSLEHDQFDNPGVYKIVQGARKRTGKVVDLPGEWRPHPNEAPGERTFIYIKPTDTLYLAPNNAYHQDIWDWIYQNFPEEYKELFHFQGVDDQGKPYDFVSDDRIDYTKVALGFLARNWEDHAMDVHMYWDEGDNRLPDHIANELESHIGEHVYQRDYQYPPTPTQMNDDSYWESQFDPYWEPETEQWPTNAQEPIDHFDKTAADNVPGAPVSDSGHWVWLDGKVGMGGIHSDIAEQLARELGYDDTQTNYLSNWIARGHCPEDMAVAVGTLKNNYPYIWNSTRDRNHVWDAVKEHVDGPPNRPLHESRTVRTPR